MWRLRNRDKTPPKGFRWLDPLTNYEVTARNYANWMSAAEAHRVGNQLPMLDTAEMEDQVCGRLEGASLREYCEEVTADNQRVASRGVGDILKAMLSSIGIQACFGCQNLQHKMNSWGPDGCEEHMPEILEFMEENAQAKNWMRFIPFREAGSKALVKMAITKARGGL